MAVESRAAPRSGWAGLFWDAFKRSGNPMVLLDGERRHVEVNGGYLELLHRPRATLIGQPVYRFVAGGPLLTPAAWREELERGEFTGSARLVRADGGLVTVQYAAHVEVVTGTRLVLFVALRTSRRARSLAARRPESPGALSDREREIVHHVALGQSGPEIADSLQITHNTVRTHVRNAMVKTGARSRAQLVARALGDGFGLR